MAAGIRMDGGRPARAVVKAAADAAARLRARGVRACLATVLVGDDPASATYVRNKHRACADAGILARDHRLGAGAPQSELDGLIARLNADASVHGMLVQLPLPPQLDAQRTASLVSPAKDVDGLTAHNAGLLAGGRADAALVPCTPAGIVEMLDYYGIALRGKHVVVVNRSGLVGRPLAHLALQRDATVTVCHSRTRGLADHCRRADIVVTAVGDRGRFVLDAGMIRSGAVVVDVAIVRTDAGRLAGDVDYDSVIEKASYVTPVPGGVGPMTVAMLLRNTLEAAERQAPDGGGSGAGSGGGSGPGGDGV